MTQRIDVHRADGDRAAVHAGHVRRLAELDPLVRVPPLEGGPEETVLVARAGDGAVTGRVRIEEVDAGSEQALWGALREFRLTPCLVGDDAEAAWDRLLSRWCRSLVDIAAPGDRDTAAVVTVPSRDLVAVRPLAHHGFAPLTNVAVRRHPGAAAGRSAPDASAPEGSAPEGSAPAVAAADEPVAGGGAADGRRRTAERRDLDDLVDLAVALHRHDASFGAVTERPTVRATLRGSLAIQLERSADLTWVAEDRDGRLVGYLAVQPPDRAVWIAQMVTAAPAAYLGDLFVRPEARGTGIGDALVAAAHRALDQAGVEVTLLHHALPSPTSTPFWARQGYRPLWTTWQRRPAAG